MLTRPRNPCLRWVLGAILLAATALDANAAELRGVVFEDVDRNGRLDQSEPGLAGVAISNGRDVVRTAADGSYTLPAEGHFVALTRPHGYSAETWYRKGGGDFALQRSTEAADEFFFIQISDAHVYEEAKDLLTWSIPKRPWWIPERIGYGLGRWVVGRFFPTRSDEEIDAELRAALPTAEPARSGGALLQAYLDEFGRPGSPLGAVAEPIRAAFDEVFALDPSFVINTGDLLLECNNAQPEVAARWLTFYRSLIRDRGVPVFDTIGNNEIVGSENPMVSPTDPDFGTGLWRRIQGPTHFSWDHGNFHFIALDTHRPEPGFLNKQAWTFGTMRDDVRTWLDQDLSLHREQTQVVLNHEPFLLDPSWPFDDEDQLASDEDLFARHGVAYVLSGHTHFNGLARDGVTEHVTTGALSGFRWLLPKSLHPGGYRLWYARNGQLYGAWKPIGEPVLTRTEPATKDSSLVIAASDRNAPFTSLIATQSGKPVPIERWGAYFARIHADPSHGPI
ncbi:MAG: hypothetical protein GY946_33425, partial [bacterium]|nr:hypothetical protein [bacterium]